MEANSDALVESALRHVDILIDMIFLISNKPWASFIPQNLELISNLLDGGTFASWNHRIGSYRAGQ